MNEVSFIDIHAHAYREDCPPPSGKFPFATPDQVLRRYDEIGIERGVLLPLIGPEYYLPQSNEDILDMCEASGGRFIPFCNIDPRGMTNSPDAPLKTWLVHYRDRGCKGVGEVMPNLPFEDPRCQNLFAQVEEAGLPLIFDISDRIGGDYGFYDDPGLPQLDRTLGRFPGLKILGHGPAFWAEIGKLEDVSGRNGYPEYSFSEEGVVPGVEEEGGDPDTGQEPGGARATVIVCDVLEPVQGRRGPVVELLQGARGIDRRQLQAGGEERFLRSDLPFEGAQEVPGIQTPQAAFLEVGHPCRKVVGHGNGHSGVQEPRPAVVPLSHELEKDIPSQ